jgi:uncharacterized protein (TIGR02611 family)
MICMSLWRKPIVAVVGALVVLAGVVMLVTPGPGLLTIAAGLAIWASEYPWAAALLERVRARLRHSLEKIDPREKR